MMSEEAAAHLQQEIDLWKEITKDTRDEIKGYKTELKSLSDKIEIMTKAYQLGFDYTSQELTVIMSHLNNDPKTGKIGLVETVSNINIRLNSLTLLIEKVIGEKESKKRRLLKIWTGIVFVGGIMWALLKDAWQHLWEIIFKTKH